MIDVFASVRMAWVREEQVWLLQGRLTKEWQPATEKNANAKAIAIRAERWAEHVHQLET